MTETYKHQAAEAALDSIESGGVLGVGSGSTVDAFIHALKPVAAKLDGAVAASEASARQLKEQGIRLLDLNEVDALPLYIDSADELTRRGALVKGGGGALTKEKIIASVSQAFLCIADHTKLVARLGAYPLPVEVVPMARSAVGRALVKLGGRPEWRADFTTENGNLILDVHDLVINEPVALEQTITLIPGVVTAGLFAKRGADRIILAGPDGLEDFRPAT